MKQLFALLLLFGIVFSFGCNKRPKTLADGGYDEKEMAAATQRARSEVDTFIGELAKGNGEDFAVKAPIEESGKTEHFWLTGISFADGYFQGTIGNEPGIVSNVKLGDKRTIAKGDISDWMFMRDGKMHGNYTLRPLLATMPKKEADKLRSILATP
jgi:uncharacterized protein YegJ (DUF2314 family)